MRKKNSLQLKAWKGKFGEDYTDRNIVDWRKRIPLFRNIIKGLPVKSILEVGCNRGHNLVVLRKLLGEKSEIAGIEPNRYAFNIAKNNNLKLRVIPGNIFSIPFNDSSFDLVFTAGVLIHISIKDLKSAMKEIYRVSKKYILAIEYFAKKETEIEYRGFSSLLWKRDFPGYYLKFFPDLTLIRSGYWKKGRLTWWLFQKNGSY